MPFCLGLLAGLSGARASGPAVLLLPVQHNLAGDASRLLDEVVGKVTERLVAQGYSVLPGRTGEGCEAVVDTRTPAALAAAASRCGAQAALMLHLDASAIGYNLHFMLVGYEGTVVADRESACDFCTEQEMIARWGELADTAGPPPAALSVAPEAGPEPEPVTAEQDEPTPVVVEQPSVWLRIGDIPWWFWASAGGSVAVSLAVGLPLILIDGEPTCDGPLESCPEIYDTDALGYTALAAGIAGLAAVSVGLYWAMEARGAGEGVEGEGPAEVGIVLVPGPVGLVLRGFF